MIFSVNTRFVLQKQEHVIYKYNYKTGNDDISFNVGETGMLNDARLWSMDKNDCCDYFFG